MELTQLNVLDYTDSLTSIKENNKASKIQDNSQDIIKNNPEDKIEIEENNNVNNLLLNISSNTTQIANLQKMQSTISTQLEITTEIVQATTSVNNSSSQKLDDKQPTIKQYMDDFNLLSEGFEKPEISDEVGIYFDGKVGSKPLSSHEILDASAQQKERLQSYQQYISEEINSLVSQTKDTIELEKPTVETKVEFKTVDYSQQSKQFNSTSLENIQGSFLPSQANAFPLHSEKLLA